MYPFWSGIVFFMTLRSGRPEAVTCLPAPGSCPRPCEVGKGFRGGPVGWAPVLFSREKAEAGAHFFNPFSLWLGSLRREGKLL